MRDCSQEDSRCEEDDDDEHRRDFSWDETRREEGDDHANRREVSQLAPRRVEYKKNAEETFPRKRPAVKKKHEKKTKNTEDIRLSE